MEFPVPEYIRSITPYIPGKPINETRRELGLGPKDPVIKLASNENSLGPSPKALIAIRKHLTEVHLYPDAYAYELRMAIQDVCGVRSDQILIGNGSNEVIDLLIRTFCVPGDAMVTTEKAFIAFRICAQIHGVRTIESLLGPDLRPDLDALLAKVRNESRARMVFLANPNNPTGTYVRQRELIEFLNGVAAIRGGSVIVVLDSAYLEYVDAPDFPDPMEVMKRFGNVVVMRTFSKIYGLAAMRVGYAIARTEIVATVEKVRQPFNTG
ncbi:MAG: aminotransferase class I/II-fold pyridoxal phosphate-dependent enzyme, partial [Bdellovibrionota bacterium]